MGIPFRPKGTTPYHQPTEKEERQIQLFSEWVRTWRRYKIEIQDPSDVNYLQQFIERPSPYRLTPPSVIDHSELTLLAITDKAGKSAIGDPDCSTHGNEPSSSSDYRTGSFEHDVSDGGMSPQNQQTIIVTQVTSDDKLGILMSSMAIGPRKSYQPSWGMRDQFYWCGEISPWFKTDFVGWDEHCLDYI